MLNVMMDAGARDYVWTVIQKTIGVSETALEG